MTQSLLPIILIACALGSEPTRDTLTDWAIDELPGVKSSWRDANNSIQGVVLDGEISKTTAEALASTNTIQHIKIVGARRPSKLFESLGNSNVQVIGLYNCHIAEEETISLSRLRSIRNITFYKCDIDSASLELLAKSSVQELVIVECRLTHTHDFKWLESLDSVQRIRIETKDVKLPRAFPKNATAVHIDMGLCGAMSIPRLSSCSRLETLSIKGASLTKEMFSQADVPPTIRKLYLTSCKGDLDLDYFPQLSNAEFVGCDFTSIAAQEPLLMLEHARWERCPVLTRDLALLSRCKHLRQLELVQCKLTEDQLVEINKLQGIKLIDITGSAIDRAHFKYIAQMSSLETVICDGTNCDDLSILSLLDLPNLLVVSAKDNGKISDVSCQLLAAKNGLQEVYLAGTSVTHRGEAFLLRNKSLRIVETGL